MNGDIGYIRAINRDNDTFKSIDVMFDFGSVHYEKDELDDLNLAYAISIHKSQGSEFGLVVVPFSFKYYLMLKRKLIYTKCMLVILIYRYMINFYDFQPVLILNT